ncbi:hypothetical protein [Streptomyces sp. CBMA156]|uniref:hypothetical protein n=1 Tax=Streptomyces sp. CBMA156 TaxID=1930280 RepID=UPI001CB812C0|nr:hypothetical protein [Streptomyces sp. CBMA156]
MEDTTRERYEGVLRLHLKPTFGARFLSDITPARVRTWRTRLLARKSVNRPSSRRTSSFAAS